MFLILHELLTVMEWYIINIIVVFCMIKSDLIHSVVDIVLLSGYQYFTWNRCVTIHKDILEQTTFDQLFGVNYIRPMDQ